MDVPSSPASTRPAESQLARRILALAIGGGWTLGRHVTEAELVQALGVSRTPVRTALQLLARAGVVASRQNAGFFLLQDAQALSTVEVAEVPTAAEQLYGRMLRDRISGKLPSQVRGADLIGRYAVGRSLLAQALARLAEDGLISGPHGRLWRFAETLTDQGSVLASYAFRIALEPSGFLLAGFLPDKSAIARLRDRHLALLARLSSGGDFDPPRAPLRTVSVSLDTDFHEGLAAMSGNPFLLAAIKQQMSLRRVLEFGVGESAASTLAWCDEHLRTLAALEAGDAREASRLLKHHLGNAQARASHERGVVLGTDSAA